MSAKATPPRTKPSASAASASNTTPPRTKQTASASAASANTPPRKSDGKDSKDSKDSKGKDDKEKDSNAALNTAVSNVTLQLAQLLQMNQEKKDAKVTPGTPPKSRAGPKEFGWAVKEYTAPLPSPIIGTKFPDIVMLFLGPSDETAKDTATGPWDPFKKKNGDWCKSILHIVKFLKAGGLDFDHYTRMDLYCNKTWVDINKKKDGKVGMQFSFGPHGDCTFAKQVWQSYAAVLKPKVVFVFGAAGWPITELFGWFKEATAKCTGKRAHKSPGLTKAHLKAHGAFGFPVAALKPHQHEDTKYVWVNHPFSATSRHRLACLTTWNARFVEYLQLKGEPGAQLIADIKSKKKSAAADEDDENDENDEDNEDNEDDEDDDDDGEGEGEGEGDDGMDDDASATAASEVAK